MSLIYLNLLKIFFTRHYGYSYDCSIRPLKFIPQLLPSSVTLGNSLKTFFVMMQIGILLVHTFLVLLWEKNEAE